MIKTETMRQPTEAARRRPQSAESLSGEAQHWLTGLPGDLRPRHLPIACARIANELSRRWKVPGSCIRYLDELLIDTRGNRAGFPLDLALELVYLKNYYETALHPTSQTVWDEIIARPKN
jgi:hypothetical protein